MPDRECEEAKTAIKEAVDKAAHALIKQDDKAPPEPPHSPPPPPPRGRDGQQPLQTVALCLNDAVGLLYQANAVMTAHVASPECGPS